MPVGALLSKLHQTHVCFWCLNESWVCFLFLSSINNNVSCLMSKIETKITNINQQELLILIHIYHKIKKGASASKQKKHCGFLVREMLHNFSRSLVAFFWFSFNAHLPSKTVRWAPGFGIVTCFCYHDNDTFHRAERIILKVLQVLRFI